MPRVKLKPHENPVFLTELREKMKELEILKFIPVSWGLYTPEMHKEEITEANAKTWNKKLYRVIKNHFKIIYPNNALNPTAFCTLQNHAIQELDGFWDFWQYNMLAAVSKVSKKKIELGQTSATNVSHNTIAFDHGALMQIVHHAFVCSRKSLEEKLKIQRVLAKHFPHCFAEQVQSEDGEMTKGVILQLLDEVFKTHDSAGLNENDPRWEQFVEKTSKFDDMRTEDSQVNEELKMLLNHYDIDSTHDWNVVGHIAFFDVSSLDYGIVQYIKNPNKSKEITNHTLYSAFLQSTDGQSLPSQQ